MSVKEIINKSVKACEEAGVYSGFARFLMLEILSEHGLDMYAMMDEKLDDTLHQKYETLMKRILNNEPMGYVLGYQWFYGYKIGVNQDVLIPREETEELVGHILNDIDDRYDNPKIVDVATGSGAIALALAKELNTSLVATDISEEALQVARQNAKDLGADVTFFQGDMLEPLIEKNLKFDVLVCNPPYIKDTEHIQSSVLEFEPHVALFGGDDGLYFYRKVLEKAHLVLNDKGMIAFEIGFDIGDALLNLAQSYFPDKEVTLVQDMNKLDRMLFIKPKTKILDREDKDEILEILKNDGLVALPTDTVYGLAIKSDSEELYNTLKEVKTRPDNKPFPLMVSDIAQLEEVVELTPLGKHLVESFMPGPITFIFNKKEDVFPYLKDQKTLGIRIADDMFVRNLIRDLNQPIWLPSANLSGEETATSSMEVLKQLDGAIDGVIWGYSLNKESSTVVDITEDKIKILREGPITQASLEKEVSNYLEKTDNFDKLDHKNKETSHER